MIYTVNYLSGEEHRSTDVEAPDEMTALFRAGAQSGLRRSEYIRARVVALGTNPDS